MIEDGLHYFCERKPRTGKVPFPLTPALSLRERVKLGHVFLSYFPGNFIPPRMRVPSDLTFYKVQCSIISRFGLSE